MGSVLVKSKDAHFVGVNLDADPMSGGIKQLQAVEILLALDYEKARRNG